MMSSLALNTILKSFFLKETKKKELEMWNKKDRMKKNLRRRVTERKRKVRKVQCKQDNGCKIERTNIPFAGQVRGVTSYKTKVVS